MTYAVIIDALAQADIDGFYQYLCQHSEATARKYVEAFYDTIERTIAARPHTFAYFAEVGAPYRALLFTVSRRTKYWIIYTVNEEKREVRILRFWNTARKPGSHGLT
jgi:plasmid stabilization system protein ParE